ncbi:MAG: IPT/TIG domain-containing protein [Deltaproteobacteria bacterium]|nr:IPT/TIG domain-containing protein [Deltaproteobacteria bacterium]
MSFANHFRTTLVLFGFSALVAGLSIGCGEAGGEMAILDVMPREGSIVGDQPVQIKGVNFRADIGYRVYFGNKKATSVTVVDPETLVVVSPEHIEEGPVEITVLADNGPAFSVQGGYAYVDQANAAQPGDETRGNLAY